MRRWAGGGGMGRREFAGIAGRDFGFLFWRRWRGGLGLEEIVGVRAGRFFEADFDRLGFGGGWGGFDGLVHKVPYLLVAGRVEGAVAGAACLAFCSSSSRRLSSAWNQASRSSGGT